MEHGIFEQILQLPSVSSIKVLTEASNRGIPIYNFDKTNIDRIDEIKVSSSVKTDVLNAVNSGKTVIIPKRKSDIMIGLAQDILLLTLTPEQQVI